MRKAGLFCLALLCALFLAAFVSGQSAYARELHAVLLRSDPLESSVASKGPAFIRLLFSEPVQPVGQAIRVLSPDNKVVRSGKLQINGLQLTMPVDISEPGTYLVIWQVISPDTDPVSGLFTFSMGHPAGPWSGTSASGVTPLGTWLQVLARWLHFLGYALGFGTLAFRQFVLRPLASSQEAGTEKMLWRLVSLGILALVLAEPLALLAQNASLGAGGLFDPDIIGDVLSSSFGRVLAQRLGAGLFLWVLVGVIRQGEERGSWMILGLGVALALIDGEASHAITSRALWLGLLANMLHVAAMGIWVGGLIAFLCLWRRQAWREQRNELAGRFGKLATLAVIELVASGLIMAWLHLVDPTDLFTTNYGKVLAAKTCVVLITLLLAFFGVRIYQNKRARWWILEAITLILILVLAALLISLPPPI
jgi:copper transport protein